MNALMTPKVRCIIRSDFFFFICTDKIHENGIIKKKNIDIKFEYLGQVKDDISPTFSLLVCDIDLNQN